MTVVVISVVLLVLMAIIAIAIHYIRSTGHLFYVILHQEEAMVIERLGKYKRVIKSGLHFLIPFLERPRKLEWRYPYDPQTGKLAPTLVGKDRISLQVAMIDIPEQEVITVDNAPISIDCLFWVKVIDPKKVVYEVDNFPVAIAKLAETGLRSIIGNMTLDQVNASRDEINTRLQRNLKTTTEAWGVELYNVEIENIKPPKELLEAMQALSIEERKKKVAITKAEAEYERITKEAQAQKDSMMLKADAEALLLERIRKILGKEDSASQYLATLRYVEAFKELVSKKDGKVVFVPYDTSNLLGSLGMVKEFFDTDVRRTKDKVSNKDIVSDNEVQRPKLEIDSADETLRQSDADKNSEEGMVL